MPLLFLRNNTAQATEHSAPLSLLTENRLPSYLKRYGLVKSLHFDSVGAGVGQSA
jgi:hypothetical protein